MNQSLELHDMVLIKDNELLAKNEWRRGVVHKLVVGCNNQVKGAILRVMETEKLII